MDKYDEAVAYLTEHPDEISAAWCVPEDGDESGCAKAHCLFQYVTPTGEACCGGRYCGCPTLIVGRSFRAWTDELTVAIRADQRIPKNPDNITIDHLSIFAEWQRRIDKELNRS